MEDRHEECSNALPGAKSRKCLSNVQLARRLLTTTPGRLFKSRLKSFFPPNLLPGLLNLTEFLVRKFGELLGQTFGGNLVRVIFGGFLPVGFTYNRFTVAG